MQSEEFSSTTRLCRVQWGLQTSLGEPTRYILTMGTHFNLNSMAFVPVTEYHCLHSNYLETFLNLWAGSKLVLWGAVFAAPLSVF